jgi:hypothetical protein
MYCFIIRICFKGTQCPHHLGLVGPWRTLTRRVQHCLEMLGSNYPLIQCHNPEKWNHYRLYCILITWLHKLHTSVLCVCVCVHTVATKVIPSYSEWSPYNWILQTTQWFQQSFHFTAHRSRPILEWPAPAKLCLVYLCNGSKSLPLQGDLQPGRGSCLVPNVVSKLDGEPLGCCAWPRTPWYLRLPDTAHC